MLFCPNPNKERMTKIKKVAVVKKRNVLKNIANAITLVCHAVVIVLVLIVKIPFIISRKEENKNFKKNQKNKESCQNNKNYNKKKIKSTKTFSICNKNNFNNNSK